MEIYEQNTVRDYLRVLFRHKAIVITTVIAVTLTVFIGLMLQTHEYEGKVKMIISAEKLVASPYYRELIGYRDVQVALTQSEIVTSNPVIERAVKAVGLYNRPLDYEKNFSTKFKKPLIGIQAKLMQGNLSKFSEEQKNSFLFRFAVEDLKKHIKVEPVRDTNLFTISVSDYSPVGSAILANVISRSFIIFDLEQQLAETQLKYGDKHPTTIQLKDSIEKMVKNLTGQPLPDIEAIGPASIKVVEQASVPMQPTGLPKTLTFVLGVFMSIFLGVMLAFTCEYLDQTFKFPFDVEKYLGLPYLGSIPKDADISYYHDLADQIYLLMKDKSLKSLLLSSSLANEGATQTIVNLGTYLSKSAGHKVLIIDANLRNPSMHKLFKNPETQGLVDVLEGRLSFDKAVKDVGSHLNILVAGKTNLNPVTLLGSKAMAEVIKDAGKDYDVVLIDCAPLSNFKDAAVMSSFVDGVALVITEGKTRKQVVKNAITPLEQKKANLIGVILNNRTYPIPERIYKRV